jgi:hypothetical protein
MMSGRLSESSQPLPGAVTCYLVGDEGILFSPASERLYRLNTTAAFMWCCYEEGLTPLAMAGAVADRFGVSRRKARRDVLRTLSEWKSQGLLAPTGYRASERRSSPPNEPRREAGTCSFLNLPLAPHEHRYRLLEAYLRIRYPCQTAETLVHPLLAHLEVDPTEDRPVVEVMLDIAWEEQGYTVFKDGQAIRDGVQLLELAPLIHREALLAAYESTDCLVAIHAAAVCQDKRSVLLPGVSGSGKSTLTAALMASGLTYLTDELGLLMPDTHLIRPAPVSLGLKRGSWPILASADNFLENRPIFLQEGNIEVRYLPPRQLPKLAAYPVTCLVFPRYAAGWPTALTPVSTAEALYRVAEAGYAVPGRLDTERVIALIDWIEHLDCYELRVGDLNEAVAVIKVLLA